MRSGRIRSALRTSRRIVTSPRPSRFGGRDSSRRTCGWRSRSSAASSIVTTRSPGSMKLESALSSVVLPEPVPPQTSRLQRRRTARPSSSASGAVSVPFSTSSSGLNPRRRKRRMVRTGPSSASGGTHDVHARAIGQAGVDERLRLVDAAAERREDALDRVPELCLGCEAGRGRLEPAAALDPGRGRPADEDLVDFGVGEQRLERPEPERPLRDPLGERLASGRVEHPRLAVDQRPDARARVLLPAGLGRLREHALAQRPREPVEGSLVGGRVHQAPAGRGCLGRGGARRGVRRHGRIAVPWTSLVRALASWPHHPAGERVAALGRDRDPQPYAGRRPTRGGEAAEPVGAEDGARRPRYAAPGLQAQAHPGRGHAAAEQPPASRASSHPRGGCAAGRWLGRAGAGSPTCGRRPAGRGARGRSW